MLSGENCQRILLVLSTVAAGLLLAGCQPRQNLHPQPDQARQWPLPPEPARIRFLFTFSSDEDLGIEASLWSRLLGKRQTYSLRQPVNVCRNSRGRIYVADLEGAVYYFEVEAKKARRQTKAVGQLLSSPVCIVIGPGDSLYVVDSALRKVLVFSPDLEPVRVLAGDFERPAGLVWDSAAQRFYLADAGAHCIYALDLAGRQQAKFGSRGAKESDFNTPTHLWLANESLYVTDAYNFQIKTLGLDGRVRSTLGELGDAAGSFARPKGVATDSFGHIYIVDALFGNVQIFDKEGHLLLFFGTNGGLEPGNFCLPNGIFIDSQNRLYIADTYHSRIQVFEYLQAQE